MKLESLSQAELTAIANSDPSMIIDKLNALGAPMGLRAFGMHQHIRSMVYPNVKAKTYSSPREELNALRKEFGSRKPASVKPAAATLPVVNKPAATITPVSDPLLAEVNRIRAESGLSPVTSFGESKRQAVAKPVRDENAKNLLHKEVNRMRAEMGMKPVQMRKEPMNDAEFAQAYKDSLRDEIIALMKVGA